MSRPPRNCARALGVFERLRASGTHRVHVDVLADVGDGAGGHAVEEGMHAHLVHQRADLRRVAPPRVYSQNVLHLVTHLKHPVRGEGLGLAVPQDTHLAVQQRSNQNSSFVGRRVPAVAKIRAVRVRRSKDMMKKVCLFVKGNRLGAYWCLR